MWNRRSFLLLIRARVRTKNAKKYRFCLALALFPFELFLLSLDALVGLIPGRAGEIVNGALAVVHGMLLSIMGGEPQTFVSVDMEHESEKYLVRVRTAGLTGDTPEYKDRFNMPYGLGFAGRLISLMLGLSIAAWLFRFAPGAIVPAALVSLLFYVLIRPIFLAIALPFNMFLFGLVTLFVDALMVKWSLGFFSPIGMDYWACMLASVIIGICYAPFAYIKRRSVPIRYAL
ncbi:phage holin family protein [Christensenellaceae bacterium OttesenSCG-928-M15]|nr:phage holin family protein [Christensenellaceae bacterium OttesenSCG-928-M15]